MRFNMPLRSQFAAITIDPISVSDQLSELNDLGGGRYIIVNPSFELTSTINVNSVRSRPRGSRRTQYSYSLSFARIIRMALSIENSFVR